MGVSLAGSIGSMMGVFYTSPDKPFQKSKHICHAISCILTSKIDLCWLGFNAFQAAALSPLLFLNPALLARAALYTAGVIGSLSYVGATAKQDQYLYLGGPLMAGLVVRKVQL